MGNCYMEKRPLALVEYTHATITSIAISENSASFIKALSGKQQVYCGHVEDGPIGLFIQVDEGKAASVPNVFACGDAVRAAWNVTFAVVDGAMVWFGAHRGSGGLRGAAHLPATALKSANSQLSDND